MPLDLTVLPVIIVGPSGQKTADAVEFLLQHGEHLRGVEEGFAVGMQSTALVFASIADTEHLADALHGVCLVANLDQEVPVREQVDCPEAHDASREEIGCTQNE